MIPCGTLPTVIGLETVFVTGFILLTEAVVELATQMELVTVSKPKFTGPPPTVIVLTAYVVGFILLTVFVPELATQIYLLTGSKKTPSGLAPTLTVFIISCVLGFI